MITCRIYSEDGAWMWSVKVWSERETEVEDDSKIFGLSNRVPQTEMGIQRSRPWKAEITSE